MSAVEQKFMGGWDTGIHGRYSPLPGAREAAIAAGFSERQLVYIVRNDLMPDAWQDCPVAAPMTEGFVEMLADWPLQDAHKKHKAYVQVEGVG